MNTTDIRDTRHDQRLFWTVAVPVTACVIGIAFTYSYKSKEVGDWIGARVWTGVRYTEWKGAIRRHKVSRAGHLPRAPSPPRAVVPQYSWGIESLKDRSGTWRSTAD